ncbi:HNH endonuclease signature motif containing protein [Haloferax prahovense]|uniref:HNH endonuclease signature motif containing protein n=1 Tax=Haloferax prahovense TaxID=381852 RepID=UPI0006797D82|nr:HNH endonuclease signature motif containing protein [Haloferax prahovense]
MPVNATKDWLSLLSREADRRGVYLDTDIDGRIFHFHLGQDPGVIGKVRYSEARERNFENEQGLKHIWHRYNREKQLIEDGSERRVVNITLDVWSKDEFNPDEHHFIFLTEQMIDQDTYSQGDQKIFITGDGQYSGPLSKYVDNWDAVFEYATNGSPDQSRQSTQVGPKNSVSDTEFTQADTSGSVINSQQETVVVSQKFKNVAYDRFDHQCVLTGIEVPELLTVSHVLGRADHRDLAEDIENVLILDWTHHMALDAGLWTFDESGRIWVEPGFETSSPYLEDSLVSRHGEKVETLTKVNNDYIEQRNQELEWWPPR